MDMGNGLFAVKLHELEQEYGRLLTRVRMFQEKSPEQFQRERERLQDDYQGQEILLDETARACRCRTMAELAALQRDYSRRAEALLHSCLTEEQRDCGCADISGRAETAALYAEYAIDFATQAMRYALIAALDAIALQTQSDTTTTEGGANPHE